MWDCGATPVKVIEHGVLVPPDIAYTGEIPKGLVVVNHLKRRGRRLGLDIFESARARLPLDLVGMDSESLGGLGEIDHEQLPALMARYRLLFNPIRYTSLGLAVCEAMSLGVPVVGLATTEMATVLGSGESGYATNDLERLVAVTEELLRDPAKAHRLGRQARHTAKVRFNIHTFAKAWRDTIAGAVNPSVNMLHAIHGR